MTDAVKPTDGEIFETHESLDEFFSPSLRTYTSLELRLVRSLRVALDKNKITKQPVADEIAQAPESTLGLSATEAAGLLQAPIIADDSVREAVEWLDDKRHFIETETGEHDYIASLRGQLPIIAFITAALTERETLKEAGIELNRANERHFNKATELHAENETLKAQYQHEYDIIDRIWKILGSPSYEELKGRSIYDLIEGLQQEAKLVEKIEDMAAEFGDDPKQCLSIIGEHIGLFRHHQRQAAIKSAGGSND